MALLCGHTVILLTLVTIQVAYSSPLLINAADHRNDERGLDLEYSEEEPLSWQDESESSLNQVDPSVPLRWRRAADDVIIPKEDNTSTKNNPQAANSKQPAQNLPLPIPSNPAVAQNSPQPPQTNQQPTQPTHNNPQVSQNNPQPTQTNPQPSQADANAGLNFADQLNLLGARLNRRLNAKLDRIQGGVNTLVDNKVNAISDLIQSVLTTGGKFPTTGLRLAFEPLRFPINVFG